MKTNGKELVSLTTRTSLPSAASLKSTNKRNEINHTHLKVLEQQHFWFFNIYLTSLSHHHIHITSPPARILRYRRSCRNWPKATPPWPKFNEESYEHTRTPHPKTNSPLLYSYQPTPLSMFYHPQSPQEQSPHRFYYFLKLFARQGWVQWTEDCGKCWPTILSRLNTLRKSDSWSMSWRS